MESVYHESTKGNVGQSCNDINQDENRVLEIAFNKSGNPFQEELKKSSNTNINFPYDKHRSKSTPSTPTLQIGPDLNASLPKLTRGNSLNENLLRENDLDNNLNNDNKLTRFKKSVLIPAAKWAYSPVTKFQNQRKSYTSSRPVDEYKIEYSVFKPLPGLKRIQLPSDISAHLHDFIEFQTNKPFEFPEGYRSENQFQVLIEQVRHVIEVDRIYPERIASGSSGSYFVFNKIEPNTSLYAKVGIFKPKSEEPFKHVEKLPYKIGSFQVFLNGYINANTWFKVHPLPTHIHLLPNSSDVEVEITEADFKFQWSKDAMLQFQQEIEKMVILDYIMRNTDRGNDNWMIKVEWVEITRDETKQIKTMRPYLKIGAIDNGLAFPWKHPNEWRSFPFGWLFLPLSLIGRPFSKGTREHYLLLLTSKLWWETTVVKLHRTFMKDKDFKERMWLKQLAVLKGQAFNVVEVLKMGFAGPLELTRRENLVVYDDLMFMPCNGDGDGDGDGGGDDNDNDGGNDLAETRQSLSVSTENADQYTPLLIKPSRIDNLQCISDPGDNYPNRNESGYERINRETEPLPKQGSRVVIERIVRETSKPPVFTWC
ncbi:LSB6 [Candida oxycetoniae]|uniref:Phosphatidylinositol 4-kinase n=1 Tax=Candida oxycetoniae TaxID=497107 RepID=A0AAI9X0D2_9ASCO|nr:LSB6 [Candida oxycetoniae]KAI3407168.2 LSB6 [Candida oxycetoniae]